MAKKGFLEKIGLIEKTGGAEDTSIDVMNIAPIEATTPVNVDTGNAIDSQNLIKDIYEKNTLTDFSKSIYKVEEFSAALPKEMPANIKKDSILGILKISNIEVSDTTKDADVRTSTLSAALNQIITDKNDLIANAEGDIENLKNMITDLENKIYNAKLDIETSTNTINSEIKKVSDLKSFIGGIE